MAGTHECTHPDLPQKLARIEANTTAALDISRRCLRCLEGNGQGGLKTEVAILKEAAKDRRGVGKMVVGGAILAIAGFAARHLVAGVP